MNQLDDGAKNRRARILPAGGFLAQQQKGWPEHLTLHLEQMRIDFGDQAEVRLDDASQLLLHLVQACTQRVLQLSQRDGSSLMAHERRPAVSLCIRSLRSMNRMSTATARS